MENWKLLTSIIHGQVASLYTKRNIRLHIPPIQVTYRAWWIMGVWGVGVTDDWQKLKRGLYVSPDTGTLNMYIYDTDPMPQSPTPKAETQMRVPFIDKIHMLLVYIYIRLILYTMYRSTKLYT